MTENQIVLGRKWIAALRSGKYNQGQGRLRVGDTYCCLGVLCDLHDAGGWEQTAFGDWHYRDERALAPTNLWNKLDIPIGQAHISSLNDKGRTFSEIADYIETRVPELKQ